MDPLESKSALKQPGTPSPKSNLKRDDGILDVVTRIRSERFGDDEQGVRERLNAQFRATLCGLLDGGGEVGGARDLERASARNEVLILERVLDASQPVSQGVVDLRDGMGVGTWEKKQRKVDR